MHQPDYVDPSTGRAELPWVRLHGARGYLDLARMLEEHPAVHLTVNFVPSLVRQLEEVVRGTGDRWLEIASRPEREWSPAERLFLVERHFSINWARAIEPRARYRELLDKRGRDTEARRLHERVAAFSDGDLRDLTVLFHLSWIGFAARRGDRELAALEQKGRGYDLADLAFVVDRQRRACAEVLPLWRRLAERKQVELASSPYYHPILPLVIDTDHAGRSRGDLPRPTRFAYPADAALQVELGMASHARTFGAPPVGMWPPEGSVSPEAVALYAAAGVRWLATDEGNLWRSRAASGERHAHGELYRAHRHAGVDLVFRDRELSDRIGFAYMHGDAGAGADDLIGRAADAAQRSAAVGDEPALIGVFLDGENPWESYEGSGEPFLRALFTRLGGHPSLRAVTISEHLAAAPTRSELPRLHSGSWIDSDFHIWIGDPVKNRAWELLGAARRRVEERLAQGDPRAKEAQARILAAEGSDWFWWFGGPFSSAEDPIFDRLFRTHLEAAYRALGDPPPALLAQPVDGDGRGSVPVALAFHPPTGMIHPAIGDEPGQRGYFAWTGAGRYEVPRGAAMAELPLLERIRFGCDRERLSFRLEGSPARADALARAAVELELTGAGRRFRVTQAGDATWTLDEAEGETWLARGEGRPAQRAGWAVLLAIPWERLGLPSGTELAFVVRIVEGALVVARFPSDGTLAVKVPDEHFEADHWSV